MGTIASQITSLTIVYWTVYSGADQSKHQSSASLAFVWEFTGTGEFPAQMASNAENIPIWWRHHGCSPGISAVSASKVILGVMGKYIYSLPIVILQLHCVH